MNTRNSRLDVTILILSKCFFFASSVLNFFMSSGLIHWQYKMLFSVDALQNMYIA